MKSACSQLFKTDLTFDFWPKRSWDTGARTHQGSFSFFCVNMEAVVITLLDFQNLNLTSCITFLDIFFTNDPSFILTKKNWNILFFKILFEITQKLCRCKTNWKCENWKWPLVSFTSIFSGSSWPIVKSMVSLEILRTSRFQKWPSFWNLVIIWGSYCQNKMWGF